MDWTVFWYYITGWVDASNRKVSLLWTSYLCEPVTYEPAYHWSYPWTSIPWSYTDLGDPVGCMEYGQHTIIGEKLIFEIVLII